MAMLTIKELAEKLGVSVITIKREIKRGRLIPEKQGRPITLISDSNPYVRARSK